ncbi:MAG: MFS transporter [Flammeovirgaceae bacterium]|nr:MAG: MFS transporter [Flammeovirgaceae bacterium]
MRVITRTVWILSLVSLFTDMASEMLYPVMPIYLKEIGFSILLIGILEGFAEATAGLSKSYFGKLSDVSGKRLPFVRLGYLLSAVSKPMMAVFVYPLWIFFSRTMDRLGKGIRTGARDAMLSDEATPETKGQVFGLHRAMDTLGAVLGPVLALLYLYFFPQNYKSLFFLAFIPGLIAIGFTFLIKDGKKDKDNKIEPQVVSFFSFVHYWKAGAPAYKKLVIGLLIFTLINSSDVFLLLKAKESGLNDTAVIAVYVFYNLVYAIAAYPLGKLSDIIGFKRVLIFGLIVFATVYAGMALSSELYQFYGLFFLYGIYAAATEGVARAWISNISNKKDTATALGTFTGFQSICTMAASALAGWIWLDFGAQATFLFSSGVALMVVLYILFVVPSHSNKTERALKLN